MPTIPGGVELVVIFFIIMLLFGAKKLPGLAESLGTSVREFRRGVREQAASDDERPTAAG
jgi:sec-independent protein translocase protein TatA